MSFSKVSRSCLLGTCSPPPPPPRHTRHTDSEVHIVLCVVWTDLSFSLQSCSYNYLTTAFTKAAQLRFYGRHACGYVSKVKPKKYVLEQTRRGFVFVCLIYFFHFRFRSGYSPFTHTAPRIKRSILISLTDSSRFVYFLLVLFVCLLSWIYSYSNCHACLFIRS